MSPEFICFERVLSEVKRARHFTHLEEADGTDPIFQGLNDCEFDRGCAANAEDDFFEFQQ